MKRAQYGSALRARTPRGLHVSLITSESNTVAAVGRLAEDDP